MFDSDIIYFQIELNINCETERAKRSAKIEGRGIEFPKYFFQKSLRTST